MNTAKNTLTRYEMTKPTFAIYGSKDLDSREYPVFTHSHNMCIMQDGKIIQYLDLERYSRKKYDNRLDSFIEDLVENKIIDLPEDYDFVLANDFLSSFFVSKNGKFRFEGELRSDLVPSLASGRLSTLDIDLGVKRTAAWTCPHELAHIFSTLPFYGQFKENSLLVSFDGASSCGNYSALLYRKGQFTLIENNWKDLGFASKFFNDNALSFHTLGAHPQEHCSVPGKLMGFASWGSYRPEIKDWLRDNQFFNGCSRHHGADILQSIRNRFGDICPEFDTHKAFQQDCAATFQHIFENAVLNKLYSLQEKFHCDDLYYGGGCALNIVTNTKIVESGMFKDVFIAPCCNDSGLSIGAATYLEMQKGNNIDIHDPYLCNAGLSQIGYGVDKNEIALVAEILIKGGIVGVCNGSAEAGPRALGNRSLIALANSRELAKKISMTVKRREWYRPVAPIMLEENARKVTEQKINGLARFMLMDFTIKPEYREQMAGVVHANNTARIQTVASESENPFMFHLLSYLYEKYGVLALINTSFNAQGEPIVHTAAQALESAKRMNLDGLVLNGKFQIMER
jgi:carbamoyltransferase